MLLQEACRAAGIRESSRLRGVSPHSCGRKISDHGAFISTELQGHTVGETSLDRDLVDVSVFAHYSIAAKACTLQILDAPTTQQGSGFFGPDIDVRREAPLDLEPLQSTFRPKIIAVAGLPRTGSTSLGTIVQLWLLLADPKYEPPGYEPWFGSVKRKDYQTYKEQNRSAWVKMHNVEGWVTELADMVVLSHRDPVEELVSTTLSFNDWGYTPEKTCQLMLDGQKDLYAAADDCCKGVAFDMQLENLVQHPKDVLRAVAVAIGVAPAALTDDVLNYAAHAYFASIPNSVQNGLPQQNQHWHTDTERAKVRAQVKQGTAQNANCTAWIQSKGAFIQ